MLFREIFEKKSVRPPTLEEAMAEALVAINTAPAPEEFKKPRIPDATIQAIYKKYAHMDFADLGTAGPRLIIDLPGIEADLKDKPEVEHCVATLMDGLLERGGALEGHKFVVSTTSDTVQSLYAAYMVTPSTSHVELDHTVSTMKRIQLKQRGPA